MLNVVSLPIFSAHQVVVEKLGKVSKRETGSLPNEIFGYKEAKANGDRYYVAASFDRGTLNGPRDFVLGDGKTYGGYLNAPLEPETKYKVYVRGATEVNGVSTKTLICTIKYRKTDVCGNHGTGCSLSVRLVPRSFHSLGERIW